MQFDAPSRPSSAPSRSARNRRLRASTVALVTATLALLAVITVPIAQAAETQRTVLDLNRQQVKSDYFPSNSQLSNTSIVNQPSDYTTASTDYFRGKWYARVTITNKPSDKLLWGQLCMWQHGARRFQFETCSRSSQFQFKSNGTYWIELNAPSTWWKLDGIGLNWNKKADVMRFFLKDPITKKLMYTSNCGGACYPGGANGDVNRHMPMGFDTEVIMVGAGKSLNPPSNWRANCPKSWSSQCNGAATANGANGTPGSGGGGGGGGGGGTTPTPTPVPNNPTPTPAPNNPTPTPGPNGGGSASGKILFVTNSGSANAGDGKIKRALESAGYDLLVVADTAVTQTQANDAKGIIVSSSVKPAEVPGFLKSVSTPLLSNEAFLWDDLGLASGPKEAAATTSIQIASGGSIAGSLSGTAQVMSPADKPNTGNPSGNATVIATVGGKATVFTYTQGAQMTSGTAPAKRVGFFMSYGAASDANAAGLAMLVRAVDWMTDGSGGGGGGNPSPTPTPNTPTPGPTPTTPPVPNGGDVILLTNAGVTNGPDAKLKSAITDAGYSIQVIRESSLTQAQADAAGVIVISSSVKPGEVPRFLKTTATPILLTEAFFADDLGMATGPKETAATTKLTVSGSHPIGAGLSGSTTVLSSANKMNAGSPAGSADVIAQASGQSAAAVYAYDAGDQMRSGSAPAKRVGFFANYNGAGVMNGSGLQLFVNALNWLAA